MPTGTERLKAFLVEMGVAYLQGDWNCFVQVGFGKPGLISWANMGPAPAQPCSEGREFQRQLLPIWGHTRERG